MRSVPVPMRPVCRVVMLPTPVGICMYAWMGKSASKHYDKEHASAVPDDLLTHVKKKNTGKNLIV